MNRMESSYRIVRECPLPRNNTRSFGSDTESQLVVQRAFTIDGVSQSIDDTAQKLITDGNVDDSTGTLDDVALHNVSVVTKDDDTHVIGFQIQSHALEARAEFHHLVGLDVLQTVNSSNTVTDTEYSASLFQVGLFFQSIRVISNFLYNSTCAS